MTRSWLEIFLERSGTGITVGEYKDMDKTSMCAVRAIGSAVGAEPQFDDKLIRMVQLKQKVKVGDRLAVEISLPEKLSRVDSPLGRAVKAHTVEYKKLTPAEIEAESSNGAKVILLGRACVTGTEKPVSHAMHVRPVGGNRVESLSDSGTFFDLKGNMEALVFRKR
jgi:hypothetical protein